MIDRVRVLLLAAFLLATVGGARAENVDPGDDGEQWAWAENTGWINAQPLGPGGPGMEVGDFQVTGWLWSENAGWINLHCLNNLTCAAAAYGVSNDGLGNLSGFAWAENAGWINFRPAGGGVRIGAGGLLEGWAWGENSGWINFSPASAGLALSIRTTWECPLAAPPAGSPELFLSGGAEPTLDWTAIPGATAFDVVRGDLPALLDAGGDFSVASIECVSRKQDGLALANRKTAELPLPGGAFFFLVRGANCAGPGTYDDGGAGLSDHRDAGIAASGRDCW